MLDAWNVTWKNTTNLRQSFVFFSTGISNENFVKSHLKTTAAHAETHCVHVDVVGLDGCFRFRVVIELPEIFHERRRRFLILEDWKNKIQDIYKSRERLEVEHFLEIW